VLQILKWKTFFNDEAAGEAKRPGSRGSQVVYRTAYGELPDIAALEKNRTDDKAVGGVGDPVRRKL